MNFAQSRPKRAEAVNGPEGPRGLVFWQHQLGSVKVRPREASFAVTRGQTLRQICATHAQVAPFSGGCERVTRSHLTIG